MTVTNPTIQNLSRWPKKGTWRVLKCIVVNGDIVISDSKRVIIPNLIRCYSASKPDKQVYFWTEFSLQVIEGAEPVIVVSKGAMDLSDAMERVIGESPVEFPRVLKLLTNYRFVVEDKQAQEIL